MSEANRFYQVAYGLTDKDNLNTVSISDGFAAKRLIRWLCAAIQCSRDGVASQIEPHETQ